jgi:competence protein ComEA
VNGGASPPVARSGRDAPDPAFWGDDAQPRRVPRPAAVGAIADRLALWRGDPRAGIALIAAVAVIAGVVWYRVGVGGDDAPARSSRTPPASAVPASASGAAHPEAGTETSSTGSTGKGAGGDVVVHVAGAVSRPGVVTLVACARVIDAVEAAGGGAADADLDRLNLAAKLVDGQRVLVQRVGEPAAPPVAGDTPIDPGSGEGGGLINLNVATQAQLEELPGIGPALASAIIAERDRRGGFRSINELRDVRGIGEQRFADLRDRVTV